MRLEYSDLYSRYEVKIEEVILEFCAKEGMKDPLDLFEVCGRVQMTDDKARKMIRYGQPSLSFHTYCSHTKNA